MNVRTLVIRWKGRDESVTVDVDTLEREREHLERSLSERFNFFLVWVGFAGTAAFYSRSHDRAFPVGVLLFGALAGGLLAQVMARTRTKLEWTLAMLRAAFSQHACVANDVPPRTTPLPALLGAIGLVGVVIPLLCVIAMLAGAAAIALGWLEATSRIGGE